MGMAEVSRRIPVGDIELACRITGCGKPVMLVHVAPVDGRRHETTFMHSLPRKTLAFLALRYDI
jgi:hypothetical protein